MPGWAALAVPALPAWPRLRFACPFPAASEGLPGFCNPFGQPLAAEACAGLSKSCGHELLKTRPPESFPFNPSHATAEPVDPAKPLLVHAILAKTGKAKLQAASRFFSHSIVLVDVHVAHLARHNNVPIQIKIPTNGRLSSVFPPESGNQKSVFEAPARFSPQPRKTALPSHVRVSPPEFDVRSSRPAQDAGQIVPFSLDALGTR
eukprot:5691626-Heterocapsa_arctica.AAC.1